MEPTSTVATDVAAAGDEGVPPSLDKGVLPPLEGVLAARRAELEEMVAEERARADGEEEAEEAREMEKALRLSLLPDPPAAAEQSPPPTQPTQPPQPPQPQPPSQPPPQPPPQPVSEGAEAVTVALAEMGFGQDAVAIALSAGVTSLDEALELLSGWTDDAKPTDASAGAGAAGGVAVQSAAVQPSGAASFPVAEAAAPRGGQADGAQAGSALTDVSPEGLSFNVSREGLLDRLRAAIRALADADPAAPPNDARALEIVQVLPPLSLFPFPFPFPIWGEGVKRSRSLPEPKIKPRSSPRPSSCFRANVNHSPHPCPL
ncbi:hypothetical protein T492DRAFT_403240 [Pavlovales sp. CCMP2436]|nr:hypothetical protein T492DRAFT_403240 [Pavlovales sp. CCMP2436]